MGQFIFATSNDHKVMTAKFVCDSFGIEFDRANVDLVEIQSDNTDEIALHKVRQAYEKLGKAVAITDDSWLIPGLNGFPGPYMKYINQWFRPEDFINLTESLDDRQIIMRQVIAYKDRENEKVFTTDIPGTILKDVRGKSEIMHFAVMSFDGGKHSVAEAEQDGITDISRRDNSWHKLCEWLQA